MRKNSGKEKEQNYFSKFLKEQAERIAELKKQNAELTAKLDECAKREREISDAIVANKKKCDEIMTEVKVKYALECERLAAFRKKWTDAARYGYLKEGYEKTDRVLKECQAELERSFADDFGITDYLSERARLDDEPALNYQALKSEAKKKKIEELSERDLEELLKQI